MDDEHKRLAMALRALAGTGSTDHQGSAAYTGSPHMLLGVATPGLRRLARDWVRANRGAAPEVILGVLDAMFASRQYEEKTLAALILAYAGARARQGDAGPRRGLAGPAGRLGRNRLAVLQCLPGRAISCRLAGVGIVAPPPGG